MYMFHEYYYCEAIWNTIQMGALEVQLMSLADTDCSFVIEVTKYQFRFFTVFLWFCVVDYIVVLLHVHELVSAC